MIDQLELWLGSFCLPCLYSLTNVDVSHASLLVVVARRKQHGSCCLAGAL